MYNPLAIEKLHVRSAMYAVQRELTRLSLQSIHKQAHSLLGSCSRQHACKGRHDVRRANWLWG